jgi:hypothetical protein
MSQAQGLGIAAVAVAAAGACVLGGCEALGLFSLGDCAADGCQELQTAAEICLNSGGPEGAVESETAVIGRQFDTAVASNWAGHLVLDLPSSEWTLAKNDAWVQDIIDRKIPVYVASNTTLSNLWDSTAGRPTVFGRELQQLVNAGYTWDGWSLLPSGGGS